MAKLYGRVTGVQTNSKGYWFVQIEDLNKEGEKVVVAAGAKENKFGGVELQEGMRIAGNTVSKEGVKGLFFKGKIKVYEDKPSNPDKLKPMVFGNAVNVAWGLYRDRVKAGEMSKDKIYPEAVKIFKEAEKTREIIYKKYSDMAERDLGSKFGDAMKQASEITDNIEEMLVVAEQMVDLHIKFEKEV